jgi:DNA-binding NarL/FixJ family response regulator
MKVVQKRIRILIAAASLIDCQLLLGALGNVRQRFSVVAFGSSREQVLEGFRNVDVALIDADLAEGSLTGLDLVAELSVSHPSTPVIVLLDKAQDDLILHAFRSGAKGVFCRSQNDFDMLCKCIQAVHEGQVWANSEQLQLLLRNLSKTVSARVSRSGATNLLAMRESQVASLVAEGLPNKQIATQLGISEHTVSNHLFRIYNKLGLSSRVELVLYVMKQADSSQPREGVGNRPWMPPDQP